MYSIISLLLSFIFSMASIVSKLDKYLYPEYSNRWDDSLLRSTILNYIKSDFHILDVGAGRGRILEMDFKNHARIVEGIDPDDRVVDNPLLTKGYVGLADSMPFFEDNRFDLIFCDNVLEHVENPESFFNEIARVLKPGGIFISKTPNKSHYVPLIARLTPISFHRFINKLRGRDSTDTFPTFYRANTKKDQLNWARKSRLKIIKQTFYEGRPEYLRMTSITYIAGWVYERLVNKLRLEKFKSIVITVMVKP